MKYQMNLKEERKKEIYPLGEKFYGKSVTGEEIDFTNYYLRKDGRPFFGICGECHYSRVHEKDWEDTILKMKMGGINIISTYCFWNHHEEVEGVFRFDGRRNIRRFIELCQKHQIYVIVRIGPYDHGEVRNGGLPDWLYGKPFDVRSLDDGFMEYTRRLYGKFAEQLAGLYFKDGGPIIGTQIENEYMHSASPWEMTTGVSNEWVPGGSDGNPYMRKLKELAREAGIITPFYTCTGWGGAAAPTDEMLPLWGGYAFWPWIFYDYRGEHPVTPEYIYREYHNNEVPETYNFEPAYEPESLPYSCCEMGGGMSCYYHYRFQLPYESVDAMANIKLAGGCNFLGYYMYRGGTNPKGEVNTYLNECQCPKLSYDYQAAIGEYGQLRPSYYRLKPLHLFTKHFAENFCEMVTRLPEGSQEIEPADPETLRYAVRSDGSRGYLFLNNYQDHVECREKKGIAVTLETEMGAVAIKDISMAAGEEAILPFHMDIGGYQLIYAKAQPLSVMQEEDGSIYFFFMPEGMTPEFAWDGSGIDKVDGKAVQEEVLHIYPDGGKMSEMVLEGRRGKVKIVLLTREQSLMYSEIESKRGRKALLCNVPVTFDGEQILIENPDETVDPVFLMYPYPDTVSVSGVEKGEPVAEGMFKGFKLRWDVKTVSLAVKEAGTLKYLVEVPEGYEDCRELLMQVQYYGDIGSAFVGGEMIADNFCNGTVWEIGLKTNWDLVKKSPVTLVVTPVKADSTVNVSSTMAGRLEQTSGFEGGVYEVKIRPVYQASVKLG